LGIFEDYGWDEADENLYLRRLLEETKGIELDAFRLLVPLVLVRANESFLINEGWVIAKSLFETTLVNIVLKTTIIIIKGNQNEYN